MTDAKEAWLISLSDEQIDQLHEGDIAVIEIDSEVFVMVHEDNADAAVDAVESGDIDVDHKEIERRD